MLFLFIELYPLSLLTILPLLNLPPFSFNHVIITNPNPLSRVRDGVTSETGRLGETATGRPPADTETRVAEDTQR
jgi:hypothetical protein